MDLDELLGNFGLGSYQMSVCGMIGLVLMYSNISPLSYAITAGDLKYRCKVPECDTNDPTYNPDWLPMAVPFRENSKEFQKCQRYQYISSNTSNINHPDIVSFNNDNCKAIFNTSSIETCDQWVFSETEKTIVTDFNIMCEENKWKLNLVGTINSLGQFVGIPLAGFISDKYGRKFVMISGSVSSALLGTLRSFTLDYNSFIILEFLDSVASSGVYAAAFVLGLELVSPQSRVTISTLIGCFYPLGGIILGFAAYMLLDWKIMLRVLYLPGLLIFGCVWYVPESIRWLQSQNRTEEVAKILSKVAKSNGMTLPANVNDALHAQSEVKTNPSKKPVENGMSVSKVIKQIFSSKDIFLRLVNCSFCWITITLVYYGLQLASVDFGGDKYINFMLSNAVEVPAFIISWFVMEYFPRRETQAFSFLLSGLSCILVNVVADNYFWLKLLLFLSSKFAISVSFNVIYVFTAEMFPTELRMSLFGIASMFGRFGSMIAPLMSLLTVNFGNYLPILIYGIISFIAGGLAFFFPETRGQKLPDTIKEAEFVGNV